jgi:hypothetical protein
MKQFKLILMLIITFYAVPCYGMTSGFIIQAIITGGKTERSNLNFASDAQVYTNGIGGVTFSYPSNWFTQPPIVQISLQQDSPHPATMTYTAEIVTNTVNATTIMVYSINSGLVNEAPTGTITVCLFALDNPL